MSSDTAPTDPVPIEQPADFPAGNSSVTGQGRASLVPGRYLFTRGVRITVTITSVSLLVTGLVLLALGGLAMNGGVSIMGYTSGLNTLITGITLLITGAVGCGVALKSRNAEVGRVILLVLVAICHASGAFAIQCAIIVGQLIGRQSDDCEGRTLPPVGEAIATVPPCTVTTSGGLPIVILIFAIVGFILGVICSASCYYVAPRLLCCLCDVYQPLKQDVERPAQGSSARRRQPNA